MITSAAARFTCMSDGRLKIIPLHRHKDFQIILKNCGINCYEDTVVLGFLTDKKQFLNPFDAKLHALECKQKFIPGKENPFNPDLQDTDLW